MKNIESLNNARKTVLRIEKEINAISNNLSRVKSKDHITMKKIIKNINYLLSKGTNESTLNKREETEEKYEEKYESKKTDETKRFDKLNLNNQYEYNSGRNIDYLLLLNKHKTDNNEKNNKQYFNRKYPSSSKMNAHNSSTEKNIPKSYNINSIKNMNGKENNVIFNRNKIIDGPNNFLNKTNQMTNSKTRLLTECSKRNSSKNINLGCRNNTSYKNKNVGAQIKNMKHSSFSRNINQVNKTNDKYQKNAILNTLYYNYRDNVDTNFLQNNYLNYNKNKIAFSYEQPNEIINNEGNFYSKEENKYENEKELKTKYS